MERNLLNERFITIEKLADGELSHKLPGLTVKFSFAETFLGEVLGTLAPDGICMLGAISINKRSIPSCFIRQIF